MHAPLDGMGGAGGAPQHTSTRIPLNPARGASPPPLAPPRQGTTAATAAAAAAAAASPSSPLPEAVIHTEAARHEARERQALLGPLTNP